MSRSWSMGAHFAPQNASYNDLSRLSNATSRYSGVRRGVPEWTLHDPPAWPSNVVVYVHHGTQTTKGLDMSGHRGQIVGYIRVSAADQNPARQLEAIGEVDRLFSEAASGGSANRSQLREMLAYVREGDVVRVKSPTGSRGRPRTS